MKTDSGTLTGLKRKPFFYDAQFKRLIVQVLAVFAGYQVRTGVQRDGKHHFMDTPVIFGGMDRAVGEDTAAGSLLRKRDFGLVRRTARELSGASHSGDRRDDRRGLRYQGCPGPDSVLKGR